MRREAGREVKVLRHCATRTRRVGLSRANPKLPAAGVWALALASLLFLAGPGAAAAAGTAPQAAAAGEPLTAVIYKDAGCDCCAEYVADTLLPELQAMGVEVLGVYDQTNAPDLGAMMAAEAGRLGLPRLLHNTVLAVVDGRLAFGGHVPPEVLRDLVAMGQAVAGVVAVNVPQMHDATSYLAWAPGGDIYRVPIGTPIGVFLEARGLVPQGAGSHAGPGASPPAAPATRPDVTGWSFAALVLTSGLLDGINPCAFVVLLFLVSLVLVLNRPRPGLATTGLTYIAGVFLVYFLVGAGSLGFLTQLGRIVSRGHLISVIGAYLLIGVGVVQVLNGFGVRLPVAPRAPAWTGAAVRRLVERGTLPAALLAGGLVALCTIPCSGGIYAAILALLATRESYAAGLGYLAAYNLMYIAPLLFALALAANPVSRVGLKRLQHGYQRETRIGLGLLMIVLAIVILAGGFV